jgi:hypothetical protein
MAFLALAVSAAVPAVAQHDHDGDSHHDRDRDEGRGKDRDWHHERDDHYVRYERHEEHHHSRIPEDHFRAHFGRENRFVIARPVYVSGHARFQYDGYWFAFARPLPPGWRYSDQVYVDSVNDNYYLFSPVHPGVRISINIL